MSWRLWADLMECPEDRNRGCRMRGAWCRWYKAPGRWWMTGRKIGTISLVVFCAATFLEAASIDEILEYRSLGR